MKTNLNDIPNENFLKMVAHDLVAKLGNNLSHTAIVFPNKRASLFFNSYLAQQATHPIWSPAYTSISELFRQLSPLKVGDPIRLVCELYKVFKQETHSEETLDSFYFWGEMLIADFDDVDKNLVNASDLFSNLQELRKLIDNFNFLEPEQEEAIKQFFHNFSIEKRTLLKEKFISMWDCLGNIYHEFQQNLIQKGIAYEGMLYRQVVEANDYSSLQHYDRFVFVGFNVLNKVEMNFFKQLQSQGKALFYWDYDQFYTQLPHQQSPAFMHEAGEFIMRNLKEFPNQLTQEQFDALRRPKTVSYISSPTENAQARYIPQWTRQIVEQSDTAIGKESAIVLCNEALLLPVLHSLPSDVKNVNITMGFPLSQTPIFSFIQAVCTLQTTGYNHTNGHFLYQEVMAVLKHPYVQLISEQAAVLADRLTRNSRFFPLPSELMPDEYLQAVFTPITGGNLGFCRYLVGLVRQVSTIYRQTEKTHHAEVFDQLYRESIFKSYTLVNRLLNLVETNELTGISTDTLIRLLQRLLTAANIPFHGEPAMGLQVMGVLETRNLDFQNLLMLSVNEGMLPKTDSDASFVPYNLRKAFGMTTIEHKNSVYAYYFYRLIQRAEHITMVYSTSSDGINRGEMSRFMLQFLVEWPHHIQRYYLDAGQSPQTTQPITIEKSPELLAHMHRHYDVRTNPKTLLSPSALNMYLDCSLKFYYRYIAGYQVPDEVNIEIDSALFGSIFHYAAELMYRHLTAVKPLIERKEIEAMLRNQPLLQRFVDQAFKELLFHIKPDEAAQYNGTQLIHTKVITLYLQQLLRNDLRYAPFTMEGMEQSVDETMLINTPQGDILLKIGGTIDRMDSKEGTLRIVDYKTGGTPKTPETMEQLFTPSPNRPGYVFQTFLYAAIMCRKQSLKVAPALLYIHRSATDTYSPYIELGSARQKTKTQVLNFALYEDEFRNRLRALLEEIFHPETTFCQTSDEDRCAYCDYKKLCGK